MWCRTVRLAFLASMIALAGCGDDSGASDSGGADAGRADSSGSDSGGSDGGSDSGGADSGGSDSGDADSRVDDAATDSSGVDTGAGCDSPADTEIRVDTAPSTVVVDEIFEVIYAIENRGPMRSMRVLMFGEITGEVRALGGSTACSFPGMGGPVICSPGDVAAGETIMVRVSFLATAPGDIEIRMLGNGTPMDTCSDDNEVTTLITATR